MCPRAAERTRDAERSRDAILAAAEKLFADRGYDGASLGEIAAEAGLSRGTPSYFFGSKEELYVDVLNRAFAARQAATEKAFEPVHEWCANAGRDLSDLRAALASAADDYLRFLARQPSFVTLIVQEELGGGRRLQARAVRSTAMQDAFEALRRSGRRRGLRAFDVGDAVLLFVVLTFAPVSYRNTLLRSVGRDLNTPAGRRRHVRLAVDQLMHLIAR
jgi:TetR/AcrR family transcriptional regulator